jgi:hypothetical protein
MYCVDLMPDALSVVNKSVSSPLPLYTVVILKPTKSNMATIISTGLKLTYYTVKRFQVSREYLLLARESSSEFFLL